MLQEITPEQFDEWYAYYLAEPWGDEWEIGGTIAAEIRNCHAESVGITPSATPKRYKRRFLTKKELAARERAANAQQEFAERVDRQRYGGV